MGGMTKITPGAVPHCILTASAHVHKSNAGIIISRLTEPKVVIVPNRF